MGRIALQNGPFRSLKRTVSRPKTGRFATRYGSVRYAPKQKHVEIMAEHVCSVVPHGYQSGTYNNA